MMETVIAKATELLSEVVPESHFLTNPRLEVTYPYLIFSYDSDGQELGKDGAYLDIDIFDNQGENQERIEKVASQLRWHLENRAAMLADCYLRFRFEGANPIDTQSDSLQRRHVRFYITIDWRRDYE